MKKGALGSQYVEIVVISLHGTSIGPVLNKLNIEKRKCFKGKPLIVIDRVNLASAAAADSSFSVSWERTAVTSLLELITNYHGFKYRTSTTKKLGQHTVFPGKSKNNLSVDQNRNCSVYLFVSNAQH